MEETKFYHSKAQPVFPEDESTGPYRIYFNEHVAQSNLKVVKTDPKSKRRGREKTTE